jgi:4-amino-4-deoxy-L-arabinose transferase-like glycosyltransferase
MRGSNNSARSATLTEAKAQPPRDAATVALLSAVLALAALAFCSQHRLLLLYGDAVAHLHIARRIFDARTPGFRQLGSVWLPLPHLLLIPFVQKMSWWQSGVAGAIPSMACYVASCVGLYRLALCFVRRSIAWIAVAFFALNPGLLYFSTTAMTEPLFLAEMIWAALLIALLARRTEAGNVEGAGRLLLGASLVLVCAVFTRYDGWIYAAAAWCVASWVVVRRRNFRERLTGMWLLATVLVVMAPLVWIAYNAKQFHDPFDFLRGPYSARAIEARTSPAGAGHYPEYHRPVVATLYFLKTAELGAVVPYATQLIFLISLIGTAFLWVRRRSVALWAASLLWLPLPFYAYAVSYGSVPIFIPVWFPHSWYNTRYGMEMLPAFALFAAAALEAVAMWRPRWQGWMVPAAAALIVTNSVLLLRAGPLVFQEAVVNSRSRIPFETTLANWLRVLPAGKTLLMYTSEHIGAVQQAGIPLRNIINEGDYYEWNAALEDPAAKADYVVALDGDAVAKAVAAHPQGLTLLQIICSTGQPCARIYIAKTAAGAMAKPAAGAIAQPAAGAMAQPAAGAIAQPAAGAMAQPAAGAPAKQGPGAAKSGA